MNTTASTLATAGLARRLAAMFYDALLLLAIYFGVTAALLYFTDGEPIPPGHAGYRLLLIAICWLFHIGFWRRAGRTLGMQSWNLRLVDVDGRIPATKKLFARLAAASFPLSLTFLGVFWPPLVLFSLGYLWVLIDRDGLALHDRLTGTRPVVDPRLPRNRAHTAKTSTTADATDRRR